MKYTKTTLKNGLRVISVPLSNLESATVTVWVKTGSRLEDSLVNGISHFLEHMVFKGSKKRPTAKEIAEAVDAIGAEVNAGTSKEWTNYYIKARAEHLRTAFDVLSDMILNPVLKKEEIEREKGVIVEEIAMHEDTPMIKIGDLFENVIFQGNTLEYDIAGTPKSVRAIDREDFVGYKKMHYYTENMLVTVSGNVKETDVERMAGYFFAGLNKGRSKVATRSFKENQSKPRTLLHPKKKEQAHFILGFLGYKMSHPKRFANVVLSSILGGGMSSRMFTEVRERRGLAYAVKTDIENYVDTGYMATYAGVQVKRIDEAVKVVLDEHYKLASKKKKISDKELKKAKEYLKGHLALSLENTIAVNEFFGLRELLLGKTETPEEIFKKLDGVTLEEVYEVAKEIFVPERLNLAIIGPYDNRERFEKLLK